MAHVLVVDDYMDCCDLVVRTLLACGHRASCAYDGERALDLIRTNPPDLVLLDVHMPGMGGIEVLRRLRADLAVADVPVVMFSADADPALRAEALALGAKDYVLKGHATLVEIEEIVDRHTASAAAA